MNFLKPRNVDRVSVYRALNEERDYQDSKWGGQVHDRGHEVEAWLIYMQAYLNKAINRVSTEKGAQGALEEMRKVVALGIACFENHGVPPRYIKGVDPLVYNRTLPNPYNQSIPSLK